MFLILVFLQRQWFKTVKTEIVSGNQRCDPGCFSVLFGNWGC